MNWWRFCNSRKQCGASRVHRVRDTRQLVNASILFCSCSDSFFFPLFATASISKPLHFFSSVWKQCCVKRPLWVSYSAVALGALFARSSKSRMDTERGHFFVHVWGIVFKLKRSLERWSVWCSVKKHGKEKQNPICINFFFDVIPLSLLTLHSSNHRPTLCAVIYARYSFDKRHYKLMQLAMM